AAEFAVRDFGVSVGEEECRGAVDACLAKGWLWVIDCKTVAEIENVLRADPVYMPLPDKVVPGQDQVDFTQAGAALHRAVSEELLGPSWADGLCVWQELDREEHRYGETEQDILCALKECRYRRYLEAVASRVVPIGPWCVYWWDRFPRGY